MTDDRRPTTDDQTAEEAGRTDLDIPDPTEGYGIVPDATDDELREAYREAEPDSSRPGE
jgi:hypothetical protein